jgi:hypothetical protein
MSPVLFASVVVVVVVIIIILDRFCIFAQASLFCDLPTLASHLAGCTD